MLLRRRQNPQEQIVQIFLQFQDHRVVSTSASAAILDKYGVVGDVIRKTALSVSPLPFVFAPNLSSLVELKTNKPGSRNEASESYRIYSLIRFNYA